MFAAAILAAPRGLYRQGAWSLRGVAGRPLKYQRSTALDRAAPEAMLEAGAHACTDVTGFGLLAHHELDLEAVAYAHRHR